MLLLEAALFLAAHWPVVLVVCTAAWLLSNKFHAGLNKYPGHWAAGWTNLWRLADVWGREPQRTHLELHRKHGDIVRLGPNVLSFADPQAIKTIYGLNKKMTKACG